MYKRHTILSLNIIYIFSLYSNTGLNHSLFLSFHQALYCQSDIDCSHISQIQYFHVLSLKNLIYYFLERVFNPLHG